MSRILLVTLAVALVTVAGVRDQTEQPSPKKKTRSQSNVQFLMRDKLEHAQNVLEGIITEDYEKVVESADWMRMIGRAASWQAIDTDEYRRHSEHFQSAAIR